MHWLRRHRDGTEKDDLERKMQSLRRGLRQGGDDQSSQVLRTQTGAAETSTAEKGAKRKPVFHLSVEGRYLPEYWMHWKCRPTLRWTPSTVFSEIPGWSVAAI